MIGKLEFGTIVMDGEAFNRPDKVGFTDGSWRTALTGIDGGGYRIQDLVPELWEEFLIARGVH